MCSFDVRVKVNVLSAINVMPLIVSLYSSGMANGGSPGVGVLPWSAFIVEAPYLGISKSWQDTFVH